MVKAKAGGSLGEMPLTLFVVVAGIVLYLYIRRANLGIDLHPKETAGVRVGGGRVAAPPPSPNRPTVLLAATVGGR